MSRDDLDTAWLGAFDAREEKIERGYVACDDLTCKAKAEPVTPDEWRVAAEHWRRHRYLAGCSHGN